MNFPAAGRRGINPSSYKYAAGGGASKGIIVINDNSVCIPLFGKEGLGEIL